MLCICVAYAVMPLMRCPSVCHVRTFCRNEYKISLNFFHRRVATSFYFFPCQVLRQYSNGDRITGAKVAIFNAYMALQSMTTERWASSKVITLSGGLCVSCRRTTKCHRQWILFMTASLDIILSAEGSGTELNCMHSWIWRSQSNL